MNFTFASLLRLNPHVESEKIFLSHALTQKFLQGALRAFRLERLTGAIARVPHSCTQPPKG